MGLMGAQQGQVDPATTAGKISSLQSVAVEVRNADIARHFYTEVLGMRVVSNDDEGEKRGPLMVQPIGGGSCIMLFQLAESGSCTLQTPEARPSLRWTGLSLSTDDIDTLHENLRCRHVQILQEPQSKPWGVRDCIFADPDGNVFNLVQQSTG